MIIVVPSPNETDWMTVAEASGSSGYSIQTIHGLITNNIIRVYVSGGRKKRYVKLSELIEWRDREVFHPPIKNSRSSRIREWLKANHDLIKNARYGDGSAIYARCINELGIEISVEGFREIYLSEGYKLRKGHTEFARKFLRRHPWLAHEENSKGHSEFVRLTGVNIDSRLWRQAKTDYLDSLHRE